MRVLIAKQRFQDVLDSDPDSNKPTAASFSARFGQQPSWKSTFIPDELEIPGKALAAPSTATGLSAKPKYD
ncbi:hypothetical protein [Renibacterium salmoninarum]|uniref:hypothetical protein n=1 Tax=Renibacterium salmoninarum TaxID=1646 RepID=UPI0013149437|nr:hypothetical protein [Renibacterium salmoninarum]